MVGVSQQEIFDHLKINPNLDIETLFLLDDEYNTSVEKNYSELPKSNLYIEELDLSPTEFFECMKDEWIMPDEYKNMDIKRYILSLCQNANEIERINIEMGLYERLKLLNVLRYCKYLRDVATQHKIVWGVGRGSSCCSYVLYLLKIHRVDSIKYELDITEFLRG
jgi:DNA polymerase III alpha subunit